MLTRKQTLKKQTDETGALLSVEPMTTKELLASEGVRIVLFLNVYTFTLAFGFTACKTTRMHRL